MQIKKCSIISKTESKRERNMRKRILTILLCLCAGVVLSGCSKSSGKSLPDIDSVSYTHLAGWRLSGRYCADIDRNDGNEAARRNDGKIIINKEISIFRNHKANCYKTSNRRNPV